MPRDYKHAAQKKTPAPGGSILPFLTGLSIGLFIAFIVYLSQSDGSYLPFQSKPETVAAIPEPDPDAVATSNTNNVSSLPAPSFDFYNILPNKEINISEWVAEEETLEESTPEYSEDSVYILQVGSFKQLEAADQVKAQLALLGVMADIQRVVINGQDTLYRVRAGPYEAQEQLNQARQRLQQNNLEFMLLKLQADDPRVSDG